MIVSCTGLTKTFGRHVALKDASLRVEFAHTLAVSYTHLTLPTIYSV